VEIREPNPSSNTFDPMANRTGSIEFDALHACKYWAPPIDQPDMGAGNGAVASD